MKDIFEEAKSGDIFQTQDGNDKIYHFKHDDEKSQYNISGVVNSNWGDHINETETSMQDIEKLMNRLHNGIVEFKYKKKDGSTRNAKGTLCPEFLPEKENEEIKLDVQAIDALLEAKGISFEEYTESNNLEYIKRENESYVFILKRKKREKQENKVIYYDLESNSFRSFIKENFVRIIK